MDHSRYFQNPYKDYSNESAPSFLKGKQLKDDLVKKIKDLDNYLLRKIDSVSNKFSVRDESSIYTGYCGIAVLYWLKYKKTKNNDYLLKAKELTSKGLSSLKGRDISFVLGDPGPLALGAIISAATGDTETSQDLIKRLLSLPKKVTSVPNEILYGWAGYLYALLLVEKEIGPIIEDGVIKDIVDKILVSGRGKSEAEKFNAPLKYEWYDTNYLGAAHGVAGILYILLCANKYLTVEQRNDLIKPTIDWLSENRFESGNFKSTAGRDNDTLIHWCHGSPGFLYLYLLSSKVFKSDEYLSLAEECGDVVWQRGLLKKGYSICHGVSGNAYTFLHLYKATQDIKHLYRAACFADWCTTYPDKEGRKPDCTYSLFEGIAGLDYFLTDILDPHNASFPAFALD